MCLCKLVMTHDSLLIVRFVFFPTLTVVGLPVLRKPRVAFQFTICRKKVLPPRAPPFPKLLSGAVACLESIRAIARQCAKEKGKHMARKNVTGSIRFFPRCGRTFRPSYVLLSVRKMSGQDGLARLLCFGMYQKHLLPSGGILAGKDLFSILRGCPACFLILKGVVISSHETNRFS